METRTIGRRKPRDIGEPGPPTDQEQAWLLSFANRRTRIPKGIFHYRTHEEANTDGGRWNAERVAATSPTPTAGYAGR